ncbi:hypothetical protein Vafri_17663 [Volvox africanus]|uniref:Uncharacterized protein n=1 Tax=Volvox africanus TaxID=51714 RepID=A0A8J4BKR5_9CHLO|nr:hypothetical protein Vafri_17663 [Volvox africanus]
MVGLLNAAAPDTPPDTALVAAEPAAPVATSPPSPFTRCCVWMRPLMPPATPTPLLFTPAPRPAAGAPAPLAAGPRAGKGRMPLRVDTTLPASPTTPSTRPIEGPLPPAELLPLAADSPLTPVSPRVLPKPPMPPGITFSRKLLSGGWTGEGSAALQTIIQHDIRFELSQLSSRVQVSAAANVRHSNPLRSTIVLLLLLLLFLLLLLSKSFHRSRGWIVPLASAMRWRHGSTRPQFPCGRVRT